MQDDNQAAMFNKVVFVSQHGLPCVKACLHCNGEDCDNGSHDDDIAAACTSYIGELH